VPPRVGRARSGTATGIIRPARLAQGCSVVDVIRGLGIWGTLELGAPEIADRGLARLNATRVALLGTVRRDGAPRISPIEPYLVAGQLLVGAMASSRKAADLRRDPRCVLHSAVTSPDSGEGEFKVYGSALEVGDDLRGAAVDAWWSAWPADRAVVFSLHIEQAVFIDWDIEHGVMAVHRWSPQDGYGRSEHSYP
jgi:hypothetical protein